MSSGLWPFSDGWRAVHSGHGVDAGGMLVGPIAMKAMTIIRAFLALGVVAVVALVIASARPSLNSPGLVLIISAVLIAVILAYIGAAVQRWLARATRVDITWPLLLLSLAVLIIFWSGALTPPGSAGCYTLEQASEMKSVGFRLWVAWSALACLGLGAAINKNDALSRFAVFIFPLAIIVSFGALLGLALGHPPLC